MSTAENPIKFIFGWYEDQVEALEGFQTRVINTIINTSPLSGIAQKFTSFTFDEINDYFDESRTELEHLVCLNLITATEAFLRADYSQRVKRRDKSEIGRAFRGLNKSKGAKISLEKHIIDLWKSNTSNKSFSDLLGLLKYRHWLAHGRYWVPKLGRNYSFDITYSISEKIIDIVSKQK
jgi:hypothetical protein